MKNILNLTLILKIFLNVLLRLKKSLYIPTSYTRKRETVFSPAAKHQLPADNGFASLHVKLINFHLSIC
jgi:hypothetical protein